MRPAINRYVELRCGQSCMILVTRVDYRESHTEGRPVTDGVKLVKEARERVFEFMEKKSSTMPGVVCRRPESRAIMVDYFKLDLALSLKLHLADNSSATASFTVHMFKQPDREEEDFDHRETNNLREEKFVPTIERDTVVWRNGAKNRTFSDEELVDYAVGMFETERKKSQ